MDSLPTNSEAPLHCSTSAGDWTVPPRRRSSVIAGLGLMLVLAATLWTVILADPVPGGRAVFDQDYYHLRAIRTFASDWPDFDLVHYRSATTPGYHIALAAVARFLSDSTPMLRIAGSLFTLAAAGMLAMHLSRRLGAMALIAVMAPLCCSLYFFGPGAWLLPDNAAWLFVLSMLLLALDGKPTTATLALSAAALLALVWCRQVHLWAAGIVWLAAWMGPGQSPLLTLPLAWHKLAPRVRTLALGVLATMPAALIVLGFARAWSGMVPPLFQPGSPDPVFKDGTMQLTGGNPATPAFLLLIVAIYAGFYVGWWFPAIIRLLRRERLVVIACLIGMAAGLLIGLIPRTTFSMADGRYTGFWALVPKFPVLMDRSLLIVLGAAAGGGALALIACSIPRRDAWILLLSLVGFTLAQSTSAFAWQRYLEPMVLIVIVLAASRTQSRHADSMALPRWARIARIAGPAVLSIILAAIAWRQLSQLPDIAGAA